MKNQTNETLLRRALLADAVISGATGVLMAAGASLLSDLLQLPEPLLRFAGLALLPFAAFVAAVAMRGRLPRAAAWAVVLINALWALDSVAILVAGWVVPNLFGAGFVLAQAAVVAGLAALQVKGLRGEVRAA
jgi:hypothetical protein